MQTRRRHHKHIATIFPEDVLQQNGSGVDAWQGCYLHARPGANSFQGFGVSEQRQALVDLHDPSLAVRHGLLKPRALGFGQWVAGGRRTGSVQAAVEPVVLFAQHIQSVDQLPLGRGSSLDRDFRLRCQIVDQSARLGALQVIQAAFQLVLSDAEVDGVMEQTELVAEIFSSQLRS